MATTDVVDADRIVFSPDACSNDNAACTYYTGRTRRWRGPPWRLNAQAHT